MLYLEYADNCAIEMWSLQNMISLPVNFPVTLERNYGKLLLCFRVIVYTGTGSSWFW